MAAFHPPSWVPRLARSPPDSIAISEFMLNEAYGRHALKTSQAPFTCGLTGQTYSAPELKQRVAQLASSLAQEIGWEVEGSSEWEKVAAVFALNTVRAHVQFSDMST